MNAHPNTFALVQIHLDSYGISWGYDRASFYSLQYTPTVWFEGVDEYVGSTNYEAIYQTHVATPTDVTIELTADPADTQTTDIHANVCIEGGGMGKTLRIYMVQVLDYYPPPGVAVDQRNCLMQAVPTMDVTLAPGECGEVVRSFTFNSTSWSDKENIKIIAWAQRNFSSSPAQVYQAAIMPWPFIPHDLPCDFDDDRDIDASDETAFLLCFSGPGIPHPLGCEEGDTEPDGDVDCDDWSVLKERWTGPPDYPGFFVTCDDDCNENVVADEWDIDAMTSIDCNGNSIPDECEMDEAGGPGYYCDPGAPPPPLASCDPDCNGNGIPDECDIAGPTSFDCNENSIPDDCDIASGTSPDDNSNGIPDECEILAPLAEDSRGIACTADSDCWTGGETETYCSIPPEAGVGVCYVPKHRYLSIVRNPEQAANSARRVKLAGGEILGWVGVPVELDPNPPHHNGLWIAEVVDSPVYDTIDFVDVWPDLLQLTGCEIATDQVYHVQAIAYGWPIDEERFYSDELELRTPTKWGDTVGACGAGVCTGPDATVGLADVLAALARFQGNPAAPVQWLDIGPSNGTAVPDQVIGLPDIMGVLGGFGGDDYPGSGPSGCP